VKRKLISSAEATPATHPLSKPCSDCPWARKALNGWLGGNTAEEWIEMAHGETHIECHVHPNVQCAGAAIYRANVGKLPRSKALLVLPSDKTLVFAGPQEFLEHHSKLPEKAPLREAPAAMKPCPCPSCTSTAVDAIKARIDEACDKLPRNEYREVLREIDDYVEVCLDAVNEDDRRERQG
jgi:hypothetical protein